MIQEQAGPLGTAAFAASGIAGFLTAATPYLQFALLCVSLVVGVLTAAWYIRRLRKDT